MSYTWHDIKLATLQKMFSSNGTGPIQIDSSTKEYIESMPQAANEGLQLLATAGKFILKSQQIVVRAIKNLLSNTFDRHYVTDGHIEFAFVGAKSYYFTVMGKQISCTITVGEEAPIVIHSEDETTIESGTQFSVFKGNLENPDGAMVTIDFTCDYPFEVRNVCLYEYNFPTDDDVPVYEEYIRYHLPSIMDSFYQLSENDLYYQGDRGDSYIAADDYYQEADRTLVIPRSQTGIYTIYYKAYPEQITQDTPDDYILEMDPEVAVLLPLYMASQLYKDDDGSVATIYRNEWEVAFDRLSQKAKIQRKEEFDSVYGWC